ncbi:MAG: hypothetical protein ACAH80_04190 [Alphaproteobacteria bacterium]
MDDDRKKLNILIDPQEGFNAASPPIDWKERFRNTLKDIDFKKIVDEIPPKTMRHKESEYNSIPYIPFDQSASMGGILAHEMGHVYKSDKDFEIYDKKIFSQKKIIIFDEIEKGSAASESFRNIFNSMTAILEDMQTSRDCGEALAESFQQGAAQPVAVRKPVSFRPREVA